ncbi:MAG TPA: hypothetical protein VFO65_14350 [Acidimicrobiales bacterium]|nr:hypothetical protein [Acidimicrobiales bacterium]
MKGFRFRLAGVLRVRGIQEDLARAAVAEAHHDHAAAEARLAAEIDRYRALVPAPGPAAPVAAFLAGRSWAELAGGTVVGARTDRALAADRLAARRDDWQQAAMRVDALERLEDRHAGEHAVEARRAEELEVGDLVTGRHARRGAAGSDGARASR